MRNFYNLIFFIFISGSLAAQKQTRVFGTPCKECNYSQKSEPLSIQNGNGTIATSYTTTVCGLDFTQASVRLEQRVFSISPSTGMAQPATYSISGIPPCAVIVKAFLYTSVSGNGIPVTASVTNPLSASSNFSMAIIGAHIDKCWGFAGSYTYRADVTSIISGNGNYIISGIPTGTATTMNDADGATLFIIYRDPSQNFTGSIVIADGCYVVQGGTATSTISGFNVCGTPSITSNFMMVGDLQQISSSGVMFNSSTTNYNLPTAGQNVWNFIQAPGAPAVSGQSSAIYGMVNPSDCFNLAVAGMYYRTNCLSCTAPGFSVSTINSPSCSVGSATAVSAGGMGPYTYTWSPTGGNSATVSGLPPGIYTVTVKDASCSIGTATVSISTTPTVAVSSSTICAGNSATLVANGAFTYSWSTGATTSQIVVSPSVNTTYTVTGSNGSCNDTKTSTVTVMSSPIINVVSSSTTICSGQTATLTVSGAASYSWSTGATTSQIVVTPSINTTYTVTGTTGSCNNVKTVSIIVNSTPTINIAASNSVVCSGNSATLTANGAFTYSWSTGASTSQIVVSPSVNTVYTVIGNNGPCSNTNTVSITVGTTPVMMTAMTSNSFICAGQTVTLSATGAISYTYNPGGITGNPIALNPTSSTTYTVLGSNGGPCIGSALITQSVSSCTGIDQLSNSGLEFGIYPNPNKGEFTLILPNAAENYFVEIYNSIGQLVRKDLVKENVIKINMSEQANGVYYLRILSDGQQVQKTKIVKE